MTLDFTCAADVWLESRCYQTPSALHGWLTGYLAAGARLTAEKWQQEATDYLELDAQPNDRMRVLLDTMYDEVLLALTAEDMSFQLWLPSDDDADVDEQVDCLAQWSKGFLDGFGASGCAQGAIAEDVMDVLRDLDAFSQARVDDPTDVSNATLYIELTEHARLAALTVFYGMNQVVAAQSKIKTLH